MLDYSTLPITPDDLRAARNYYGLSQVRAAEESGLPAHKWKLFEAGNYVPDMPFLTGVRTFFEKRGYEFRGTRRPGESAKEAGQVFPASMVGIGSEGGADGQGGRPQRATFHHMRIALKDEDQMGRVLDLIEQNELKSEELSNLPVEAGFFGGLSESAQATHAEALKLLAENGMLFAMLFGRSIGGEPDTGIVAGKARPATQAELLHQRQADAHRIVAGDRDALAQRRAKKPAESLLTALFG